MPVDPPEKESDPPAAVRVYRMENDLGFGPVPARAAKASVHVAAIDRLIRDLKFAPWMRAIIGRKSPASITTRHEDWVFGTTRLRDIQDYADSWRGRGCALSVYAVPPVLLVEGDSEVMFWRGGFHGLREMPVGRRHPSGLAPHLQHRIPEPSLVKILGSIDLEAEPGLIERLINAEP